MKTKILTYGDWLKEWMKIYKKPYLKKHSYKCYDIIIRLHIPKYVKDTPLTSLNALTLQKALNNVSLSRSALDVYDIYHASISFAYKLDLIPKDVSLLLIKPKHVRKKGKALTEDERQNFLKAVENSRLKNYYLFCLFTGCRRSEALNVCLEDIDFVNKKIHIRGTKTATSDRYIPLFKDLENLLNCMELKSGRLFRHYKDTVTKHFREYCPNHKLHDLRHTFATRCIECGVSLKVIQLWLGHSKLETTADIYSHILQNFEDKESDKLLF